MKHFHYGWVMAFIAAGIQATQALVVYTFGIFLRPLTMEFDWERGALSGAFSVFWLIMGFLSIVSGRLSDKYGPRTLLTLAGLLLGTGFLLMSRIDSLWQVYLFWGLFMGIGASCIVVPILSTIPRWFTKRRGIAVSIPLTGFGLGAVMAPPFAQWLISAYGWRQSFLILGLITFVIVIPLAQFIRHSPQRVGLKPYGGSENIEDRRFRNSAVEGLSFTQAISTGGFWIYGLIHLCFFFCLQIVIVHIAPYAVDLGISAIMAASILSIIAGSSVIGRLSMGFISDKVSGRLALSGCLTQATLALIWLLFARDTWMFYVFAIVFGVSYGSMVPLGTIIPAELFGLRFLGVILGTLMLLSTVGGAVGPPLSGYIFDITGSYGLALTICVIVCSLAAILSLILLRYKVKGG